ncbi:hypothetical protein PoB_002627000 [Plakobranchus ocellatus]|uniref:Secreted protein n=1 Tax=Plakobranchus ocellatus TaxID=259542 RepID=A0AAV3ZX38_9GAST|nr:hypothetical protein PoB_002627000 [Plakobranchus ocellatus]
MRHLSTFLRSQLLASCFMHLHAPPFHLPPITTVGQLFHASLCATFPPSSDHNCWPVPSCIFMRHLSTFLRSQLLASCFMHLHAPPFHLPPITIVGQFLHASSCATFPPSSDHSYGRFLKGVW